MFRSLWAIFLSLTFFTVTAVAQDSATQSTTSADEVAAEPEVAAQQEQQEESSSSSDSGRVEKLEVTGSHIKRIDVEGPSPVLTLDREYLDKSGYNSVADVLRDTTVSGLGGARESGLSGGAGAGAATTSVRGMGADSILVLMDGKRLPTIGGSTTVDLNLIPMAAIERVDVLKDGASAIYGSDALGGVINFITKKDYDGASISLNHQQPEQTGGMRSDVTATYGKNGSNYNFLSILQYRGNEAVGMRQRDFFIPTEEYFSPTGSPGSWKNHSDPLTAWNAGGGADPCTGPTKNTGQCSFDYSPYMNVIPQIEQYSALLKGGYNINENLEVNARVIYTRREVLTQLAPPPDRFFDDRVIVDGVVVQGIDSRIPKAVADAWGLPPGSTTVNANPGEAGKDVDVLYRLVEEAGPRRNQVNSQNIGATTGVKGYLGDSWEWEVYGNYAESKTQNRGVSGYANKTILRDLAIANPAAFNPFAAPGSKGNIASALYVPELNINSNIGTVGLAASGEVFDLPAGPVAVAVGVLTNWQTFEQTADAVTAGGSQWGGGTSAEGGGRRDFQSAYTEFGIQALSNLEVQLAGRFDTFSDFGSTVNPKVGIQYKPLKSLMLRTSWGTGFKAPALDDLYSAQTVGFPFGIDPIAGVGTEQYRVIGGGNPLLKEETSESLNVGAVWQILERLSFTADWYMNNQDDLVASGSLRNIFDAEAKGINLAQYGIQVIRDPAGTGPVKEIFAPLVNIASRETQGLEFRLAYSLPVFGGWNASAIWDYSYLLQVDTVPFPGLPKEAQVGFAGIPYWRNNVVLGLGNSSMAFSTTVRSIGEQNKSALDPFGVENGPQGKTRDHTEVDIRGSYTFDFGGTASLAVRNIFDTDRPLQIEHQANGFLNTGLYDPFGRTVILNYTHNF